MSRLGEYDPAQVDAAMTKRVQDLRSAVAQLRARAEDCPWSISGEQCRATLSALASFDAMIGRLDQGSRLDVLYGELEPSKWMRSAQEVSDGLKVQAQTFADGSVLALLEQSAYDIEDQLARAGAVAGKIALGVGAAGLLTTIGIVALGIYLLPKVLPLVLPALVPTARYHGRPARRRRAR